MSAYVFVEEQEILILTSSNPTMEKTYHWAALAWHMVEAARSPFLTRSKKWHVSKELYDFLLLHTEHITMHEDCLHTSPTPATHHGHFLLGSSSFVWLCPHVFHFLLMGWKTNNMAVHPFKTD